MPRRVLMALVRGYRFFLSPWLGSACRFEPTCSRYALEALERHRALAGSALAGSRLLRCHPWCAGGCDAVPEAPPRLFAHLGLGARAATGLGPAAGPASPNTNTNTNTNGPLPG
ncbi:MAG: membrane protein insertion efficiency factor YidD, partial [Rubrivivax sp.]